MFIIGECDAFSFEHGGGFCNANLHFELNERFSGRRAGVKETFMYRDSEIHFKPAGFR